MTGPLGGGGEGEGREEGRGKGGWGERKREEGGEERRALNAGPRGGRSRERVGLWIAFHLAASPASALEGAGAGACGRQALFSAGIFPRMHALGAFIYVLPSMFGKGN